MEYIEAIENDIDAVWELVQETIKTIYPKYYPAEVVDFFCEHHCKENIAKDVEDGRLGIVSQIRNWLKPGGVLFVAYQEGDVMDKTANEDTTAFAEAMRVIGWEYEVKDISEDSYDMLMNKRKVALAYKDRFEGEDNGTWGDMLIEQTDYVLVSKQHRNVGAGRTLTYHYVRWCMENGIRIVFHWPDGEHPEKIYYDAGFRYVETVHAGRASYGTNEKLLL